MNNAHLKMKKANVSENKVLKKKVRDAKAAALSTQELVRL